jgi:hypothetical protein
MDERHLMAAARCVERNPVRAGLARNLIPKRPGPAPKKPVTKKRR